MDLAECSADLPERSGIPAERSAGLEAGPGILQSGVQVLQRALCEELIRRFLLHVLPKGFMRVRHFGFLANRCRARCLELIRAAIAAPPPVPEPATAEPAATAPFDGYPCPQCRTGRLHVTMHLAPQRRGQGMMNVPALG